MPHLLVQKWGALRAHLEADAGGRLAPFRNAVFRLSLNDETAIAPALKRVASTHGLGVALGSYPGEQVGRRGGRRCSGGW